ncbi:MAG: helix-turn-helix transcriptional regulator [Coriobacteriales bacterium]|jgi:transcriptional regulator with XRE-family HTH domain|nr:helix-turn-helix transcriptional regulator [Coriobacteriales bacterium]
MATYGNLKAEMARNGITQKRLAEFLGMTPQNVKMKFAGQVKFSLDECKSIRREIFPGLSLDYLFADNDMAEVRIGARPLTYDEFVSGAPGPGLGDDIYLLPRDAERRTRLRPDGGGELYMEPPGLCLRAGDADTAEGGGAA